MDAILKANIEYEKKEQELLKEGKGHLKGELNEPKPPDLPTDLTNAPNRGATVIPAPTQKSEEESDVSENQQFIRYI